MSIRLQIILGFLMMLASLATVAWIGVTENQRLTETAESQLAKRIEVGAELFDRNCKVCHGDHAQGIPGLCPPVNSLTLLTQRARETGWSGSIHDFVYHTIANGRLVSTRPNEYVGQKPSGAMAMPFWSQEYGGPLRPDQIEDITFYLLNFTDEGEGAAAGTPTPAAAPSDPLALGEQLYQQNACGSCHALAAVGAVGAVGPTHEDLAQTSEARITDPNYAGQATTGREYIAESIRNPAAHIVEGFQNQMPPYAQLSDDQLNALVEFLYTTTSQ